MYRGYEYRIYPDKVQTHLIEQTFGCCRLVYNLALELKIYVYKSQGINLSAYDLCHQLVELKKEYKWLQEIDSQALQATVKLVDVAFKMFFKRKCKGYPKYKSNHSKQSFHCPNNTRKIDFEKGLLSIPKIANIPIRVSRTFEGKIKTITIRKTSTGKYYASILVEDALKEPQKLPIEASKTIGIDLGLSCLLILDDGTKIENPNYLRNNIKRLKVLQRRLSNKKKGSKNRKKAIRQVVHCHEHIANKRKDTLQKLSTRIVSDSQVTTICVETLAVKNMIQNHKLAQSISDSGWAMLVDMLAYKTARSGKNLIKISRFEPSTKTCSPCGAINEMLTLKNREWTCIECHSTHDRDINAAKNIKIMGLQQSRRGMSEESVESRPKGRAVKQKGRNTVSQSVQ